MSVLGGEEEGGCAEDGTFVGATEKSTKGGGGGLTVDAEGEEARECDAGVAREEALGTVGGTDGGEADGGPGGEDGG